MRDLLRPEAHDGLADISVLALAHIGDAVFELMARTWLCGNGAATAKKLHSGAVGLASAKAQAAAVERILPELDDEELAVYKRGRNAHVSTAPRASTQGEYHAATGVETLFGHLYLNGRAKRLNELFRIVIRNSES